MTTTPPVPTPRQKTPPYCNVRANGGISPQPVYANSSQVGASPEHSGVGSIRSEPSLSSNVDSVRARQMEQEIHLLRMSVNDKDTKLTQVQRDLTYSHDQIKQLHVLLAEKKESILTYQERISDMQSEIGNLREASTHQGFQPLPDMREAQQANEALKLQMTQLRAQLAEVNQQNTDLRTQNRDLSWQLQQLRRERPPLRASTSNNGSDDAQALRTQHAEAVKENHMLRSRVELLTHQVSTYNEDFRAERADRERAQTKIQEQKEEIAGFKQMIVVLARDHGIQLDAYGLGHLPQQLQ